METALEWFDDINFVEQLCGLSCSEFELCSDRHEHPRYYVIVKDRWPLTGSTVASVFVSDIEIEVNWSVEKRIFSISDPGFDPADILDLFRQLCRAKEDAC